MTRKLTLLAVVWLLFTTFVHPVAAEVVPVVRTKTETFHNVELISKTDTHAFLKHSRGVATLKLADLDHEALVGLGLASASGMNSAGTGVEVAGATEEGEAAAAGELTGKVRESMAPMLAVLAGIWLLVLGGVVLLYVFYMILVWMICKKAGSETGWWIWVPFPVLQRYALLRAAGMSWLWILAGVVLMAGVVLNVVAGLIGADQSQSVSLGLLLAGLALYTAEHVIWSVKISKARGKGVLTMICLIFPLTFPLAFLYLAFSSEGNSVEESEPLRPMRLEPLPSS